LLEQYLAELLGAADCEGLAGKPMNLGLKRGDAGSKFGRHAREFGAIDLDCLRAPLPQVAGTSRPVDAVIDARHRFGMEPRRKTLPQPECDIGILGGIARCIGERYLVEAQLVAPAAADILEADADMFEMEQRKLVHAVIMIARVKVEAHHHRVVDWRDRDILTREHVEIIFDIMPRP